MKRIVLLLLAAAWMLSLAACGQTGGRESFAPPGPENEETASDTSNAAGETSSEESPQITEEAAGSHILVAYFTWAENAAFPEGDEEVEAMASPSVVVPGNVGQLAGWVQEETGGDLFSIRVTDPYPSDWDTCLARANEERGDNARPKLRENVENPDQYDTVFLGYPNWWYGVPMALLSFLEQNDLSGKDVYLFCSHGTGGLANSVEQITDAAPEAVISDNIFDCYEEEASSSREDIQAWGRNRIFCELNDSPAARSLLTQLPLAQAGTGTLAYYEPWGDVVFFYGEYNENPGLFELGQVVSGKELIAQMSGTITIEIAE